ncbi:MAG TPA: PTS sugar transporter subunit IIB [Soehngenia sp.]|nr:PTS sugar transporter subunit IIB [Soehngenia sp.]
MKAIVLIGHGNLPNAMKNVITMITGEEDGIFSVPLLPEYGKKEYLDKLDELDEQLKIYDKLFIFADIKGGSPANSAFEKFSKDNRAVIFTGMNLPMLLSTVMGEEDIEIILNEAKNSIMVIVDNYMKVSVHTEKKEVEKMDHSSESKNDNREKYTIKGVRVDYRGIHGQVATAWTSKLGIDRIIVIDDDIIKDDIQIAALKMAKPNSVKLSVLGVEKAFERLNDKETYIGENILVIITKIETLSKLDKLGYRFKEVIIGNVPRREGTTQYRKTVYLNDEEKDIIKHLISTGTDFIAQMVPNDPKVDFNKLIL